MAAAPGNKYAAKAKRWERAIAEALDMQSRVDGNDALRALAKKLIEMAMAGDMVAMKELGDRLDGRPVQAIAGEIAHRYVARMPEVAASTEEWTKRFPPPQLPPPTQH